MIFSHHGTAVSYYGYIHISEMLFSRGAALPEAIMYRQQTSGEIRKEPVSIHNPQRPDAVYKRAGSSSVSHIQSYTTSSPSAYTLIFTMGYPNVSKNSFIPIIKQIMAE